MTIREKMIQIAADLELAATGLRDESCDVAVAAAVVRQTVTHIKQRLEDLEYEAKHPLASGPSSPAAQVQPKDHL